MNWDSEKSRESSDASISSSFLHCLFGPIDAVPGSINVLSDESWSDILHLLISFVNSRLRGGCQSDIQSKLPNERAEETESAKENGFDTNTQLFV